tara:strand:- start:303 stop:503 length:201 start_codon:yes stop_codon:yes gene_type:complete
MYYINYKPTRISKWGTLVSCKKNMTIESFDYRHHAERALEEVRYYDPNGEYWVSTKACKGWNNADK